MPRPHVSFSELQVFRNFCQHRWKLDYLCGHRSTTYGVHLDFGTAMHETIELFHSRRPCPGVDIDVAVFIFKKKFQWLFDQNSGKYRDKERQAGSEFFLEAGERIIRRFHECAELSEAEVVYNEFPLLEPIPRTDGLGVKFKGFVDLVVKTKSKRGKTVLFVVDFKTAMWGWGRDKRQDVSLQEQLFLYKHFLCQKFDLDPSNVRTAFVILKKKPRPGDSPVEWLPVSAGPVVVGRAIEGLNKTLTEMSARESRDNFVKNRDNCTNKFGDVCPYKGTPLCPDEG